MKAIKKDHYAYRHDIFEIRSILSLIILFAYDGSKFDVHTRILLINVYCLVHDPYIPES